MLTFEHRRCGFGVQILRTGVHAFDAVPPPFSSAAESDLMKIMKTENGSATEFVFPPTMEDAQPLKTYSEDTQPLRALSEHACNDPGFNPYDTGVHRAIAFATKARARR